MPQAVYLSLPRQSFEHFVMKKILVCTNLRANPNQPSCAARGSEALANELNQVIKKQNIAIEVEHTDCLGFCEIGINLRLSPNGDFIHQANNSEQCKTAILSAVKKFSRQD